MSSADRSFVGGILSAGRPTALGGTVKSLPVVENCVVNPGSFEASGEFAGLAYVGLVYGTDGAPAVETCLWPAGDEHVAGSVDYTTGAITYPADTGPYGSAVADFSDSALVEKLNANSPDTWAMGVNGYPVLAWQTNLVAADYSGVDDALAKIPADLSLYTAESAAAVEAARDAVDRTLTADRQGEVDAMAEAIEAALDALEEVPAPKPEQDADDKDNLPAAGDPTVLLAPAFALTGGAVLLARRRVA